MDLVHPLVQQFSETYSSQEEGILKEIAQFTATQYTEAHMLSGQVQGFLLKMISWMIRPKRVLEIGTFTGYSALCLADGLADDGVLHTIESDQKSFTVADNFFKKSALYSKIKLHRGDAKQIIPKLNETWDLVFLDAEKTGYIDYYNLIFPRIKKNGFILADNILFHGKALEAEPKGKSAKAIKEFNEFIHTQTNIEKVVLTLRDGLYLLRKL